MKTLSIPVAFCVAFLCGCAHQKQAQTKPIYQRAWVGGHFETVQTPTAIRMNSARIGKQGALISRLEKDSPLDKAGLQEADVVLAVNGAKVRFEEQIFKAIERNGPSPATFTIYRNGEVLDKTVTPGIERYQKIHSVAFGLALTTSFNVDVYPNPDFSLGPIGFETKRDRLDLRDPKSKYLKELATQENRSQTQDGWQGVRSEEGWKFWLGPIWFTQNKSILSQE